ncbi:ABC transporter substrate-binding protein [Calidifontimicrobium sp. SYSU G02091]|uniref:ABC transporter substrate-binding protein n=1 Tax=Calidifontimicrobium sp. SYSU G02091 TaxID=2926421 RepID=UPI001F53D61A|nr:ABC transporter substrate-binding protein [Calidifontimicrobium sp. SYSU G02091]MCI1193244.1 ABC transporter substrate-binding protein [Calidifontimicrobium sp. SYSU G02091]
MSLPMLPRRACLALAAVAALGAPLAAHAQLQEVTYLLPAPATLVAFGPWMVAQAKGYYEQEGLKVNFVSGRGGVDVAKQIGAGNAVVGGAIGDTPIIARAQGIPVKAVAVLGQGSLMALVSHKDERIESPRELKGRTVTTISYTDTTYYALLGMLSKVGLTKNDVNIQAAGPAGVWQQFAAKKAAAMAAVPDWTVAAMEAGAQVDILPADIYFKSMAQAILAADDTIQKNPQLIQKLVRATLKGMKDIMADPKAATAVYVKHVPVHQGKEDTVLKTFELYNKYVYAAQKVPGTMDETRLGELQKFYVGNGVVPREVPLKDLYTNQFVAAK